MRRLIPFIIICNLLLSLFGVRQFAHYCCDERSEAYFAAPSCECEDERTCEEEEDSNCCKDEVKIAQLVQNGISSQKSELSKPVSLSLFDSKTVDQSYSFTNNGRSPYLCFKGEYESPPVYLKNRRLLI